MGEGEAEREGDGEGESDSESGRKDDGVSQCGGQCKSQSQALVEREERRSDQCYS